MQPLGVPSPVNQSIPHKQKPRKKVLFAGGLYLIPAFMLIGVFYGYPLVLTLIQSMFRLEFTINLTSGTFIGFDNYSRAFQDPLVLQSLGFTLLYTFLTVIFEISLGLGFALLSFQLPKKIQGMFRTLLLIPWATPPIIQASLWRWLLNSDAGPIGDLLVRLGLVDQAPLFLSQPTLALVAVILASVWKGSSMTAMLFIGGRAMIQKSLYESATLEGAGSFRSFLLITLPLLIPTMTVALLFRAQDGIRVFDLIYGLTGGGPGNSTETLSSFTYNAFFRSAQFGSGSAYATLTLLLSGILGAFIILRMIKTFEFKRVRD